MRKEKENLAAAFSNEKGSRIRLQDDLKEREYKLSMQERELQDLRL